MSRALTRNAFASAGQVALSALAMFLLYRILLSHLSVDEIGLWALIVGSVTIARLSEFGLGTGVVRYVAHDLGAGDGARAATTVTMGVVGVFAFISAAAACVYPIALPIVAGAIPSELSDEAAALLPLSLIALVLGSTSNAFMSALDGCQRMDVRATIQLGGNLVQLALAWLLTPRYGLVSLGWIQIAQSCVTLIANAILTIVLLRQPVSSYFHWEGARFRELIRFGGSIQLAALGQMLFEPVVKIFLTGFGGLALTGYFEMANRLTQQFRTILVSAYNALVPHVAARLGAGATQDEIVQSYVRSSRLLLAIAFPYFAGVGAALPIILYLWAGEVSRTFQATAIVMWVAWTVNTLAAPAYFMFMASGRLRWIIASQFTIGIANVVLSSALGYLFGGIGVLCAAAIALAVGSLLIPAKFQAENGIHAGALIRMSTLPGVALWFAAGTVAAYAGRQFEPFPQTLAMLIVSAVALGLLAFDPAVYRYTQRFLVMRRRRR